MEEVNAPAIMYTDATGVNIFAEVVVNANLKAMALENG